MSPAAPWAVQWPRIVSGGISALAGASVTATAFAANAVLTNAIGYASPGATRGDRLNGPLATFPVWLDA